MARDFTKNTANYMDLGTDALNALFSGATDLSIHAWINADTFTTVNTDRNRILSQKITGTNSNGLALFISGQAAPKVGLQGRSQTADAIQRVIGATEVTTGAWHSVGGVLDIDGDNIRIYLDGVQDTSTAVTFGATSYTTGTAPTAGDMMGGQEDPPSTAELQFDGRIGEVAIWTTDIGTVGFEQLNDGFSPLFVRPDALVAYWPLIGNFSPETDIISAKNGTITGTIAKAAHPRIIYPTSFQDRRFTTAAAAAGGKTDWPKFQRQGFWNWEF